MTLTKEQSDQLKDFFPVQAHEFLQGKTYIAEEWVTDRLDQVDPSWSFERLEIAVRENTVTATFRLTVCGVSRDGVGMDTIKNGAGEAEKSAATDALKRAARLFGVGRYILSMGKAVSDQRTLTDWLAKQRKLNPQTGEIQQTTPIIDADFKKSEDALAKLTQTGTESHQEGATGVSSVSTTPTTTQTQKTGAERLGTPNGQRIGQSTGYNIGDLKTRALKEIYDNNVFHMNKSLDKLNAAGLLPATLTLEQALEVIRTRKESVAS